MIFDELRGVYLWQCAILHESHELDVAVNL